VADERQEGRNVSCGSSGRASARSYACVKLSVRGEESTSSNPVGWLSVLFWTLETLSAVTTNKKKSWVCWVFFSCPMFWVSLIALQNFITCTPTFSSAQVSTPKKMEWTAVHSKKIGVGSCALQNVDFFGVKCCLLQFFGVYFECTPNFWECTWSALQTFWSGLKWHSKTFGVDFRCTPNFEWTFECLIVYSKEVKNFGVERCPLQIYILEWTASHSKKIGVERCPLQIYILEWTASHSKKIGVHTFPLQIGGPPIYQVS
jgi:hypothetical protein